MLEVALDVQQAPITGLALIAVYQEELAQLESRESL